MDWILLEENLGETLPSCVKVFLSICGYDTFISLKGISVNNLTEIEEYISGNGNDAIRDLVCCHAEYYQKQNRFKLLPGHRALILELPKYSVIPEMSSSNTRLPNATFSLILQKLIQTAESNANKDKFHSSYSDVIRFYATYVFLLCGRRGYELLRNNLPLPSTKTVCKLNWLFLVELPIVTFS